MSSTAPPRPLFYHEQVAIIYIRVSTEYQTQADSNSIETQKRLCKELCERKGIPVSKIIEQVRSGRKRRQELVDIIEKELQRGDAIVVWAVSRFARSQKMTHDLVDTLTKKKCRLLSYSENLDTLDDDKFLGLYAWVAEMESKQISERVKMSLTSKKMRGEHTGAVPYGYKFIDGKGSPLEQEPEKMAIIEKMRKMHTEDKLSFYAISQKLNAEGVLPPRGKKVCGWTPKSVENIIRRDESKVNTLGKRSWYIENDPTKVETMNDEISDTESDSEVGESEEMEMKKMNDAEEPIKEEKPKQEIKNPLASKPIAVLRALAMKRKVEFGLTDEIIRDLSADDLALILS